MARYNYRQSDPALPAPTQPHARLRAWLLARPEMPYVLPFFAYVLIMLPGGFGNLFGIDWEKLWLTALPITYPLKSALAALLLWFFWPYYTTIRWHKLHFGLLAGLLGTLLWIGTQYALQRLGISHPPEPSSLYNPDLYLSGWHKTLFLCLRVAGPTLVVPFMEELFFRDFLMRAFIRTPATANAPAGWAHFQDVPIGTFSWLSLLLMSALFGINHGRMFLAGALYGLLMAILLIRTKSLGACIVAHATTNFTLYLYVIYAGDWQFM